MSISIMNMVFSSSCSIGSILLIMRNQCTITNIFPRISFIDIISFSIDCPSFVLIFYVYLLSISCVLEFDGNSITFRIWFMLASFASNVSLLYMLFSNL